MAKILLATSLIVAYGYMVEAFMACYSGNVYERYMIWNRMTRPVQAHVLGPDLLQRARAAAAVVPEVPPQHPGLFVMAMIVNVGMWLERYVIIVVSLSRDFLPSSWGMYKGTVFDWSMFLGTIGLFIALLFLFIRLLPMISIFEMRTILPEAKVRRGGA